MNDKWGRNFLGTPPQGRADYAFMQHIIASMNSNTGRCAILFPHGVLFRDEEKEIRKNLILQDDIECVIGLGPNLFYNSPMEACIIICNKNKTPEMKNRILMINAVHEVIRKNGESLLLDKHIEKISSTYHEKREIEGFSKVTSLDEIKEKDYNLNISLYAYKGFLEISEEVLHDDAIESWQNSAALTKQAYNKLMALINQ